jgi:hypothetical protein
LFEGISIALRQRQMESNGGCALALLLFVAAGIAGGLASFAFDVDMDRGFKIAFSIAAVGLVAFAYGATRR